MKDGVGRGSGGPQYRTDRPKERRMIKRTVVSRKGDFRGELKKGPWTKTPEGVTGRDGTSRQVDGRE